MSKLFTKGNIFTLTNLLLFAVFGVALTIFFRPHTLTLDQNIKYETVVAITFIIISAITALMIFRPNQLKISTESVLFLSLVLMLISTVFNIATSIAVTVFFVLCAIIYALVHKKIQKPHPLFYFIAGYYIFQLIGLSWSIDFKNGLHTIDKGISFILIPLAFCLYPISDETRKKILKIFFRAIFIFMLVSIIGYVYQVYFNKVGLLAGLGFNKFYLNSKLVDASSYYAVMCWSRYGHPTFLAFIITLCFGIGVYFHDHEKESESRISIFELLIFAGLSMMLIVFLQSRLGMVLFPVGALISILWSMRKNKKVFYSIFAVATTLGVVGVTYIYKSHKNFFFDSPRSIMYELTQKSIHEHLWFGTGTGGMRKIVIDFANPHNQYYGEILHLGVVGALVMAILLGATIYFGIKNRNVLLLYFMILFMMLMLTEMPLTIQKGVTFFSLFVSLFIRPEWSKSDSTLNKANNKL